MKTFSGNRALAFLACVLAVVTNAAEAQVQRVYLRPQKVTVTGSQPSAILRGMCLDKDINGAPGSADRITEFSDAGSLVIHRIENGNRVASRTVAQDAAAKDVWVEFRGANDISNGINLQVTTKRQEPGVSYEVEVVRGLATARERVDDGVNDRLVSDEKLLKRLKIYEPAFTITDRLLNELAVFSEQSPIKSWAEAQAQQSVVWESAREGSAAPEELAKSTEGFVDSVIDAVRKAQGSEQELMACFVAGEANLTAVQRRFFADRGVNLPAESDLPVGVRSAFAQFCEDASVELSRIQLSGQPVMGQVLAVEFRRTNGELSPNALRTNKYSDVLVEVSRVVAKVVERTSLERNPRLNAALRKSSRATLDTIDQLEQTIASLKSPVVFELRNDGGQIVMNRNGWKSPVPLAEITETRSNRDYPDLDQVFTERAVFDIRSLSDDSATIVPKTMKILSDKTPDRTWTPRRFLTSEQDPSVRLNNLLDIGQFEVHTGGSFDASPIGKKVVPMLKNADGGPLRITSSDGRSVEFHLDHNKDSGEFLNGLIRKAESGEFRDKHVIVLTCFKENDASAFKRLRDAALKGGSASILMPSETLDIPAAALALRTLERNPYILDGATPELALERVFLKTASELRKSISEESDPDILEHLTTTFGADAADLFRNKSGELQRRRLEQTARALKIDWKTWSMHVQNHQPRLSLKNS